MIYCEKAERVPVYRFEGWQGRGLVHAITGRTGGVSQGQWATLNLGHTVHDNPEHVDENHRLLYETLGIDGEQVVTASQVAGERVAIVTQADTGRISPDTDALVTAEPNVYLMLRYADCVPVLLWAPEHGVVGVAHAGWRGTVKGVVANAAATMIGELGCAPRDIHAGIGPSIGPCCFEVGPEVVAAFEERFADHPEVIARRLPEGKAMVDLWQANAVQLLDMGISQVEISSHCTMCEHEAFYSHRADRGATGRFCAIIGRYGGER